MSGSVFLARSEATVRETTALLNVEIRRSGSLAGDVTLLLGVTGDTATEGQDFRLAGGGSFVIPSGLDHLLVPLTILNDRLAEGTEALTFSIISATGAMLAAPRTQRISILDDEAPSPTPPAEPPLISEVTVTREVLARGLDQPVHFTFSPLDPQQIFLVEKGGLLKTLDLATGAVATLLDLSARVNSAADRGLLDVALHPDFAHHPYVYLFAVMDPPEAGGRTGLAGPDGTGNRYAQLLRYTADASTGYHTLVPGSEVVLLGGAGHSLADISGGGALDFTDPALGAQPASDRLSDPGDWVIGGFTQDYLKVDSRSHAGGKLLFGPDGMLYVTTGDGTSFNYADPHSPDAQSLDSLSGKVLRLDPLTGWGLADNPFAAGAAGLDANQAKIFQLGLRNPFSAAFNAEGQLFLADVGWSSFEEINTGGPGANFGWPYFEGADAGRLVRTIGYRDMPQASVFYDAVTAGGIRITTPFRALAHDSAAPGFQAQAITAAGIVGPGSPYPAALQGDLIFADFVGGNLYALDMHNSAELRFLADWGNSGPVHLLQGPDGLLHYADIYTGQIGRLVITQAGPLQPQQLAPLGAAGLLDGLTGEYQLTADAPRQLGGMVVTTRVDLRAEAVFRFQMSFGADEAGADGMGFALHGAGLEALGGGGGNLGFRDLAHALGVEFDIYANRGEIANDHSMIQVTGTGGAKSAVTDLGQIEDGAWHDVEIAWNPLAHGLSLRFDGVARGSLVVDVVGQVLGGSPYAHALVTGATGGLGTELRMRGFSADVTYEDVAGNQAPVLFGGPRRDMVVAENTSLPLLTPRASDAEQDALTWSLAGPDAQRFVIEPGTGTLRFAARADFEAPADANADNIYEMTLQVSDPLGALARQLLRVTVTDTTNETLLGGVGADLLRGAGGADVLAGGAGADTLLAGAGDDTIFAAANDGDDLIQGAAGTDLYSLEGLAGPASVSLLSGWARGGEIGRDTLSGIEHVTGGAGADTLRGDAQANRLEGGPGNDLLFGEAGDDTLLGGAGRDRLEGGAGHDVYRFLSRAEGRDTIQGYLASEDQLEFSAAGFGGGLRPGMDLAGEGRFVESLTGLATSAAGLGQFTFETDTGLLRYDPDGRGGVAAIVLLGFTGLSTLGAGEFQIIA